MFDQRLIEALRANASAPKKKSRTRWEGDRIVLDEGPQQPQQKNWLVDQISTVGGIGGGILGALLGTAAGPVGTVAGGAGGSALGSGAGEFLENLLTGEKDVTKNVGQEALLGGVFGAGPIRAGNVLYQGGKALAQGAGKQGAKEAAEKAATATPIRDALRLGRGGGEAGKTTITGRLKTSGDKALASQYGVLSAPTRRVTDPANTVRQLADIGITKPQDAERIGQALTGSEGLLTRKVADAVAGSGRVKTDSVRQVFTDAMDNLGLVDKDRKSLQSMFDAQMKRLYGGARGSLKPDADPTETMAVIRTFEKRIADLRGKGGNYKMTDGVRGDMADAIELARDELRDQLFETAGANKALGKVLTPQLREELVSLNPKSKEWTKFVDEQIMKAKDVGSLRSAQAPFVRVGKMIAEGEDNAFSVGGQMVRGGGGIKDALMQGVQNLAKNPAARMYAGATRKLAGNGDEVAEAATRQAVTPKGVATRLGILGALTGDQAPPQTPSDLEALQAEENALMAQEATLAGQQLPAEEPSIGGLKKSDLESLMVQAINQGDSGGFTRFKQLYDMLPQGQTGMPDLNASAQQDLTSLDSVEGSISALDSGYDATAGSGNGISGGIATIMGNVGLNDNARAFNSKLAAAAREYGRAMGEGAAGSNADAAAYMGLMPLLSDAPELKAQKITYMREQLARRRQRIIGYSAQGGGQQQQIPQ